MNDETVKLLITNMPAIITAVGVIVTAYLSYRSNQQSKANAAKIEQVHDSVNGKMEKLLDVATTAARAEGVLEEKERDPIKPTGAKTDPIHVETK